MPKPTGRAGKFEEIYLSAAHAAEFRAAGDGGTNAERVRGVDVLTVRGGYPAERTIVGPEDYQDLRQFAVEYESRTANAIGESPGLRTFFMYVGRCPGAGARRFVSAGTGP